MPLPFDITLNPDDDIIYATVDQYPNEISFTLTDQDGNIVFENGNFFENEYNVGQAIYNPIDGIPIGIGENTIIIRQIDMAGNISEESDPLTFNVAPPWTELGNILLFNNTGKTVSWTVNNGTHTVDPGESNTVNETRLFETGGEESLSYNIVILDDPTMAGVDGVNQFTDPATFWSGGLANLDEKDKVHIASNGGAHPTEFGGDATIYSPIIYPETNSISYAMYFLGAFDSGGPNPALLLYNSNQISIDKRPTSITGPMDQNELLFSSLLGNYYTLKSIKISSSGFF